MEGFTKVIRPGDKVFVKISYEIRNGKDRLSIVGVVDPNWKGDAEAAGQVVEYLDSIKNLAPGWTPEMVKRLKEVWERWHLNDMRPGCEHQRAEGWEDRRIPPEELSESVAAITANRDERGIIATWVLPEEHPEGLLGKPCPVCGYRYGTKWLHEPVPGEVIYWLKSLPDTDRDPAWV